MINDCSNSILSEEYMDFIVDFELDNPEEMRAQGICSTRIDNTFSVVYWPLASLPENILVIYGYKVFVRLFGLMDIASLEASTVIRLRNIPGLNLRGQEVLLGFVDTGIDYTHPAFQYADGTTKIVSIWDQTIQGGSTPEGFEYGSEYTREQINLALQNENPASVVPSTDDIGHGTFLAGVAAGNPDNENDFSGVVPDSEIIMVKLKQAKQNLRAFYVVPEDAICYQENDIMLGVKYLIDTANRLGRPISICIGLGTSQGAHDEQGAINRFLTTLTQMDGVSVSIAAGNEGNSRNHYEGRLRPGIDNESIELNVGPNEPGFVMEIWADAPNTFSIELNTPGGEFVPRIYPRLGEERDVGFIFEATRIQIFFLIIGARSGAQLAILRFRNPTEGIWKLRIFKGSRDLELRFNIWLPITAFISEATYFVNSSPYITLTAPGTSYLPLVATAYDYVNENLYLNASRGFNRIDQITPSLAAPGVNIIGPVPGNGYTTMSGTSVAAAHAAGISAMLLEWGKVRGNVLYMDGTDVKNLLLRGARRDADQIYPNPEWGYGVIDIYGTFERLRGNF